MENLTHAFRETNLVFQLIQEPQIKSKTVMSWCSGKKIRKFVFYLIVLCIEYTFRIYILLHIKEHYFIPFCLFLKSSKTFSVSLRQIECGVQNGAAESRPIKILSIRLRNL